MDLRRSNVRAQLKSPHYHGYVQPRSAHLFRAVSVWAVNSLSISIRYSFQLCPFLVNCSVLGRPPLTPFYCLRVSLTNWIVLICAARSIWFEIICWLFSQLIRGYGTAICDARSCLPGLVCALKETEPPQRRLLLIVSIRNYCSHMLAQ